MEDDLSIASYLTDILQLLGCECRLLSSGHKVLETVKEWKPDLVTLDLAIPSPDGLELLGILKKDPETKSIPIFIVSAIVHQPGVYAKLKAAQFIFQKPLDTKEFMDAVRTACGSDGS